jgi:hypothetical protein
MGGEVGTGLNRGSQPMDKISQLYLMIIMAADPNPVSTGGDHFTIIEIYAE